MSKKTRNKSSVKPARKASSPKPKKPSSKSTVRSSRLISVKKSSAKASGKANGAAGAGPAGKPAVSMEKSPARASSTQSALLIEGQAAPTFNLPCAGGQHLTLQDFAGRNLVLFFYPRANTPGCTREAMDFSRLAKSFETSNTAVVGISADPLQAQESFKNKYQLQTPLLSDEKTETLKLFGVWSQKSMYGKSFMGIVRTTVLIDTHGMIARIWRNVRVDGHADEVLSVARSL
jgi:thioredoxin-dependent peroxiredoxin